MSASFKSRAASLSCAAGISATSILLIIGLILPRAAHAQGAAAGAAAVAGVVIEAVGKLTDWVDNRSNDCKVAALGAAWGKDCMLDKEECTDTGMFYADCHSEADNDCGHGFGQGYAGKTNIWGTECKLSPFALAFVKPLHQLDDAHFGRGWAKANVKGKSDSKDKAPGGSQPGLLSPLDVFPPGTIVAHIRVDTLSLSAAAVETSRASVNLLFRFDGAVAWNGWATLDGATGVVALGGALVGTPVTQWFDPITGHWEARIFGYTFDYVIGVLGGVAAPGASTTAERIVDVEAEGNATADAAEGSTGGPGSFVPVTPGDLHQNNTVGEPLLMGQNVAIIFPLTVMNSPNLFGPAMSDFQLWDPQSNLSVGVLDFRDYHYLVPGMQVMVRGTVTHHEGRTVLCDTEIDPTGLFGPLQPTMPEPIAALVNQAELREGSLVQIDAARLFGNDPWPPEGEGGVLKVTDPSGATIDLEIDPDTDLDGSAPPVGPFQLFGFLSQYDCDTQHQSPSARGNLATKAGGPGYLDGYRIRPRSCADIVSAVGGVGDLPLRTGNPAFELRQNRPNPFNPVTMISFRLHQEGPVRLRVYSIDGRLVRTLLDEPRMAGEQSASWDGRDDSGRALPSGLYLYSLEAAGQRESRKMLMMK